MFKRTHIASAVVMAFTCQFAFAQEEAPNTPENNVDEMEVIQVSGIRGSLNKALDEKRASVQIVDAIVAEDIGKFPDNNVVEALQRVTGVQTTGRGAGEVSAVSIRGLTDVNTTVNGRAIFTGAGRDVALQDIPASLLSGVTVYKTRSADQIERGIAGAIDIKTHRPFNFEGEKVVLAARAIYSDQPDEVDPNISALLSNRWEIDGAGEFGALFNISYAETHYRDDTITAGAVLPYFTNYPHPNYTPYSLIPKTGSQGVNWDEGLENGLASDVGSMMNVDGVPTEYLLGRDAIFGTSFTGLRKRPAASVSLQWAPNETLEITAEGFYTGYENESQNAMWFSNTYENGNGFIETPTVFDGTNVIKEKQAIGAGGFQSGDFSYGKTDSYLYALGAEWQASDYLTINTEVVYQDSEYKTDFFAMRFDRISTGLDVDFNDNDGIPGIAFWDNPNTAVNEADMAAIENWNAGTVYDNGGGNAGDALTFTFDAEYLIGGTYFDKVKFGGRYEKRTAEEFTRTQDKNLKDLTSVSSLIDMLAAAGAADDGSGIVFQVNDYFDGRADTFDSFISANGGYMLDNASAVRQVYNLDDEDVYKTFDIEENSFALYATTNFFLTENISGEIGVRYVKYEQDMQFTAEVTPNSNVFESSAADASVSKVLPSLVLNWNITDDVVGRIAYTNTLRMPNFTDLNALQYWTEPLTEGAEYGTGVGGNPELKPEESTNYDASLEWYFAESSSLYGAYFKREIDGRIVSGRKVVMRPRASDGKIIPFALSAPVNASEGELSGFELGLVYFPESLPEYLNGLGVQASYTSLDSSQLTPEYYDDGTISRFVKSKMAGVSDESYSIVGIYERDSFDMRLSYVWRSEFYTGNEAAIFANPIQFWNRPEQSLDFQFSYNVNDDLVVTFDATNILDDVYQSYYGEGNDNLFNFGNGIYSRTFALGARYSF
ncbi:TonB-dependent receptor [Pseudoalteromonas sp. ACER1]|uniref:TonB-dependent receptor n=2 Tax=Pseudoalteromonas TaxID=53246 RepID=UPI001F3045F1|nr:MULTISPECIES: TonB-dependent receptor [unclassified Pseudoalteromonas]MCF2845775.1 TonB-dependent receptor [Pseudoalteromonas sp. PAST1]MCO7209130.1 TonB-dependent receptor [Pseudoalteromonas sp. ACER1]